MDIVTFLKSKREKAVRVITYFAVGFFGLLIWYFVTLDTFYKSMKTTNEVVFESPNYPETHNGSTTILKFFMDKQFAGIKISFYDWYLEQENIKNTTEDSEEEIEDSVCDKLSLRFNGFKLRNSEAMCGDLTGYTILVDRSFNTAGMQCLEIRIRLGAKDVKCKWKFKVSQISKEEFKLKKILGNKIRNRRQSILWENDENEYMGLPVETPLIANGIKTDLVNVPWQVSIRDMSKPPVFGELRNCSPSCGQHFCGGSLISNNLILSAAHCFSSWSEFRSLSSLRIIVGDPSPCFTSDHIKSAQSHEIQSVYAHYGFDIDSYINDIVLIKLKTSVTFNEHVKPIQLSTTKAENYEGKTAYVTGWGRTILTSPKSHSSSLMLGKVILESNDFCSENYPYISRANEHLRKSIVCSSLTPTTSSSGKGDSGGPLYSGEEESNLIGVVSFILPDKNMSYFQSVTFFRNWIELAIHF